MTADPTPVTRKLTSVARVYFGLDEDPNSQGVYMAKLDFADGQWLRLSFESEVAMDRWRTELQRLFDHEELEGCDCHILKSFPFKGASVEGIEVDGYRLTVTGWLTRSAPKDVQVPDPLVRLQGSINNRIKQLEGLIQIEKDKLTKLPRHYTPWQENLRPPKTAFERLGEDF